MQTCRLIYRSIATDEFVSNEMLRDLENSASQKNAGQGITGLLALAGNVFVQVLEGESAEVNALYHRIAADSRHGDVQLLSFESAVTPLFGDWSMRLIDLFDLPGEQRVVMAEKYGDENGDIRVPEELPRVYALLLDAKHICTNTPWLQSPQESPPAKAETC